MIGSKQKDHTMNNVLKLFIVFNLLIFLSLSYAQPKTLPHLKPILWKGKKWEYLVEHPTDVQYIHVIRFEELLDTMGQHGWELTEVTSEHHFYAFYFKRPLLAHKLVAHRKRVSRLIASRKKRETKLQKKINKAHREALILKKQKQALELKMMIAKQAEQIAAKREAKLAKTLQSEIKSSNDSVQKKQKEMKLEEAIIKSGQEEIQQEKLKAKLQKEWVKVSREETQQEKLEKTLKQLEHSRHPVA